MSLLASSWTVVENFVNGPFITNGLTTVGTISVAGIGAWAALKAKGRVETANAVIGVKNGQSIVEKLDALAANQNALLDLVTEQNSTLEHYGERIEKLEKG